MAAGFRNLYSAAGSSGAEILEDMIDWSVFERATESAEHILITTHVRPDSDALGSELGMAALLARPGRRITIFNASPTPARYRFLDPAGDRISFLAPGVDPPATHPDLILVVDTGTWSQLAGLKDWVRGSSARRLVVDHHVTQDDLGGTALVDVSAPACGLLVYEAFQTLGRTIDEPSATALFAAIATDTGWMHHSNTNRRALESLGHLVDLGAKPHEIHRQLYERNTLARYRLLGTLLQSIELAADGRLAHATIMLADVRAAGAHMMDTEDFVQTLMGVEGVEAAGLFIEQDGGGTKVSLRSRGAVDCAALAARFGGGGHVPAAGVTMKEPPAAARQVVLTGMLYSLGTPARL